MTQFQRDKVKEALQKSGIANPSYVNGEFILYRSGGRHLCLKEQNPLLVFFGPQYEIMRGWADRVISAFATEKFPDWECCRQNRDDPGGPCAVWFQFKKRNSQGDWSDHIDSVVKVAVALYNKLNEEGILSDSFDATKYNDVNNVGHQGVVAMNEKTKEAFRRWMNVNGIKEVAGKQYVGYMERHIAQGRCLNALDDQGNPVDNIGALVKDLSANHDDWNAFSQNIQGADNSKDQYKVALGKFIEFAKSVRDGAPPQNPANKEGQQKEPKEMKPRNLIVFGAPGTGKSYKLNEEVRQNFVDGEGNKRYERVTFYPTYSYAQFVGTYKPVMKSVKDAQGNPTGEEEISYEFVPGPFLRVLVNALNEVPDVDGKKKDWCLVIEEINRANAAAVFGDVFQLLDRGADGVSEYAIAASEDVKKYLLGDKGLNETGKNALRALTESLDSLKIPANMYIWATMNSADQGVFPMDTAFKRRWEFDYIGIDDEAQGDCLNWHIEGKGYKWNDIRRYINGLLAEHDVNEDKLMGPYFVKADGNHDISKESFASKVLMYLWEDAGRMIRRNLFGNQIKTYSQLVQEWGRNEGGVKVFAQCNKKENLPPDLKNLYAQWTMPIAGQEA